MKDDIRPRGTVQVPCSGKWCVPPIGKGGWEFWVDALDPRLPEGPFVCSHCEYLAGIEASTGKDIVWMPTYDTIDGVTYEGANVFFTDGTSVPPDPRYLVKHE